MDETYREAALAVLRSCPDAWSGEPLAELLCLKGVPGAAERVGGTVCSGVDGAAIDKAVVALGYDEGAWAAVDVSRFGGDGLRAVVEAIDPSAVIALDVPAAEAFASAYGAELPEAGSATSVRGRAFVALDGFEEALADDDAKRVAWHRMKLVARRR